MAVHENALNNANDPSIVSAVYDGNSVRVIWQPSADTGVTGYVIQLAYLGAGEAVLTHQSAVIAGRTSNLGSLTLTEPLNTDVSYQVVVQAQWDDTPGQNSAPLILPTARPTLLSALYDGHALRLSWEPSPQAGAGYQVVVFSNNIGTTYTAVNASTSATTYPDVGFVAKSQLCDSSTGAIRTPLTGTYFEYTPATVNGNPPHDRLLQDAVAIRGRAGSTNAAVDAFIAYVGSTAGRAIILKNCYI